MIISWCGVAGKCLLLLCFARIAIPSLSPLSRQFLHFYSIPFPPLKKNNQTHPSESFPSSSSLFQTAVVFPASTKSNRRKRSERDHNYARNLSCVLLVSLASRE